MPLEGAGLVTVLKFPVQRFEYFVKSEVVTKVKHFVILGCDVVWFGQIYRLFGGMDCIFGAANRPAPHHVPVAFIVLHFPLCLAIYLFNIREISSYECMV